jgi:hypothetical protein
LPPAEAQLSHHQGLGHHLGLVGFLAECQILEEHDLRPVDKKANMSPRNVIQEQNIPKTHP